MLTRPTHLQTDVTYDAVAVGETMAMLAPEPVGPLREAAQLRVDIAGAESNVAGNLAALGLRCAFVSRVGIDPFGELVVRRLTEAGVECLIRAVPDHPTGVYFKDPQVGHTRVFYYRRGSAASTMDDDDVPQARLVHLSGVMAALSPSCACLVRRLLEERQPVSFDVNYRPGLWPAQTAAPVLADLANRADVVFVGRDEAALLWGTGSCDDVRAVLSKPRVLVVKDGATEAVSFGPSGRRRVPAVKVDVVESVGAGDAFAAGYLFGLLRDAPEPLRLSLGHHVAAAALRSTDDLGVVGEPARLLADAERHLAT